MGDRGCELLLSQGWWDENITASWDSEKIATTQYLNPFQIPL